MKDEAHPSPFAAFAGNMLHFQELAAFSYVALLEYWLATKRGRVPLVAVCVLHAQLRICCATDSAII